MIQTSLTALSWQAFQLANHLRRPDLVEHGWFPMQVDGFVGHGHFPFELLLFVRLFPDLVIYS